MKKADTKPTVEARPTPLPRSSQAAADDVAEAEAEVEAEAEAVQTDTQVVDAIMAQMTLGTVAFNTPATINIQETVSIHVALSPTESAAALEERVEGPGQKVSAALQVANNMEARLTGEGFKIVPVTSERQAVSSGVTEWIWDVTPLTAGKHQLSLTIDALINVNGETVPKTLRTFRKPIEVEVTAIQHVSGVINDHGKWLWTTLLVPIVAWGARKRRARKKSAAQRA